MPSTNLPPPIRGWNTLDALADMPEDCAVTLDNWFPGPGGVSVRSGYRDWATGLPGPIGGLMAYRSGFTNRLFAASDGSIFDVSSSGDVGAPVISGLASSYVDGVMMNAAGGDYLLAFNGADTPRVYDGAGWANWTATGIPANVSWACNHKGRLWVGSSNMSAYYGAPLAFTGAYQEFPIRGVARRGGYIAGMASWTVDGGNGPDDVAAFFTTEGEVLVYSGLDPSDAATWGLRGRFDLPRPVQRRFLRQFGSDILVLTEGGIFTLSTLLSGVDAAALSKRALTRQVESAFRDMVQDRSTVPGWDLASLPSLGMWMVNVPWGASNAQQIAFNGATGAPARFLGIKASCWLETGGDAYFGHADEGRVCLFGQDADDAGDAIASEALQAFSDFGRAGSHKRFTLAAPALGDAALSAVRVDMALDWIVPMPEAVERGPSAPPLVPLLPYQTLIWDEGNWDEAYWSGKTPVTRSWRAVQGIGHAGAVRLRLLTLGQQPTWVGTGIIYEIGGALG